ncbi:MAG TPA: hypothetical protein VK959_00200 [Methylophilaceae bacterium]|nr:hypothetical protein [Methylophilaceae bacterium]
MNIKPKALAKPLSDFGAYDLLKAVRTTDSGDRFYKFIYDRVNDQHKQELDLYFKDDPCNVAYLASAIRHIFAHGWLTPSAGGGDAAQAVLICDMISEFVLSFLDHSFSNSIKSGLKTMNGT